MSLASTLIRATAGDSSTAGGWVARAASVILVAACALAGQVPPRFTLGDSRAEVRRAQGAPTLVERLTSQGVEIWSYGSASVTFDARSGAVVGWSDPTHTLRTALRWARRSNRTSLKLGDHFDDVARLHGTPWSVTQHPVTSDWFFAYGRSVLRLSRDSVVTGWRRRDAALKVDLEDDSLAAGRMELLAPRPRAIELSPRPTSGTAELVVAAKEVSDANGDGRLDLREFADVRVTLRNVGPRPTPMLRGTIVRTRDLHTIAGTLDTFTVAPLAAGATTQVSLAVYVTADSIPQSVGVRLSYDGIDALTFSLPIATTRATGTVPAGVGLLADLPRPQSRNPDALAVIIGVERYQRLPPARFAANDAQVVRELVTRSLGVPNDAMHLTYRTDEQATAAEFAKLLGESGWLARRATENSDIIVYFAGHGAPDVQHNVPLLLPFDADGSYLNATGIALPDLLERLAKLPAKSITVFLDACFTGATRDAKSLIPGTRGAVVSIEHPALLRRNMAVFVASRDGQVASDSPAALHGLFTLALARGLKGQADANRDLQLSIYELGQFVESDVVAMAAAVDREQRPLLIARDSARVLARFAK